MEDDIHYVGLMFEDKVSSTEEKPFFRGRIYTYKTNMDLKEGQVLTIETNYGHSKVCCVKPLIKEEELNFDKDLIKEIVEYIPEDSLKEDLGSGLE